ncbi:hypothetical protein MRX96_046985 [Rhipicephalus microplus]
MVRRGETIRRHSDQVKPRELEHDQGEVGDSRCLETAGGAPSRRNTEASANKERDRREPLNSGVASLGPATQTPRPLLTVGGAE